MQESPCNSIEVLPDSPGQSGGQKKSAFVCDKKKAEGLKNSKVSIESMFYEWLMEELDESETEHFCEMLDRLYLRSKKESRSGFLQVKERMDRGEKDG